MKNFYLVFLFLSSFCYSQDEALLGEWTLNSIFDSDIYLVDPINPIIIEFSSDANSIIIDSFCGEIYQNSYTTSTSENTIIITESNWTSVSCNDDDQGWEVAINSLFNINNGDSKDLTYTITDNGTTTSLELSYSYISDGTAEDVTGYFTKTNTSAQEIVGNWYLKSVTQNGFTYNNVYNNLPLNFNDDILFQNYLSFDVSSSCNSLTGAYTATHNEVQIHEVNATLLDCSNDPYGIYESLYIPVLTNNYNYPSTLSYTIVGSGDEQILTLTNDNGDFIVYQKEETNALLIRTWYLQSISDNGTTYNLDASASPSLSIGRDIHPVFPSIAFNGTGICNTFNGDYYIYLGNGDEIDIVSFTPTTNVCNPASAFENAYFTILGDESNNTFNFEITNNGENLILTSVSDVAGRSVTDTGIVLTFSKEVLSVDEFDDIAEAIVILKNPVEDQLELNITPHLLYQNLKYSIFNSNGKLILNSELSKSSINVNNLLSGLYFISFSYNTNKTLTTLKFIKK